MTSLSATALRPALRLTGTRVLPRLGLARQRALLEVAYRTRPPRGTQVHPVWLGDRRADRVSAPGCREDAAVLLLHGGCFMTMSPRTHRAFAGHVAAAAGLPVFVLDHRLAPEHPHPADVEDAVAAFDALRVPTALLGDSAGGTLALLTAMVLRDRGGRQPTALALVSPCADLTQRSVRAYAGREIALSRDWVAQGVDAYLGTRVPQTVSPLHRDLSGLPPALVHWSEHECLRPESEALVAAIHAVGGDATGACLPGVWHDVHLNAGVVPEGTAAARELGAFLAARA